MFPAILHINHEEWDQHRLEAELLSEKQAWKKEGLDFAIRLLSPEVKVLTFQTSGTTGTPKQVSFTKQQVLYSAANSCAFFEIKKGHTLLLCLPAQYVAGRLMMARACYAGADLIWVQPVLSPLQQVPAAENIFFAALTPAQVMETIAEKHTDQVFRNIQKVLIGGGEISETLENTLMEYPQEIYASYAMTETLTHVAVRKIGENIYRAVYRDAIFSINADGCLCISIPSLLPDPLVTKDLVELVDETSFVWKGRLDNVINSGGVKLYPEEMEKKIRRSGFLGEERFYISRKKDDKFGELPVMIIAGNAGMYDLISLTEAVNALLNKHEKIKGIIFLDKFEYTTTGKIKRQSF